MHNFFQSGICQGKERTKHPTQKPLGILKHIIEIASNPGDLIFDPFMGSGSTGVAAKLSDRNFIGFELEHEYYELSKNRIDSTSSYNLDFFVENLD